MTNFGTTLCPEALSPLAEPLPPDSAGATGVEMAGLTIEPTACLFEGEGGLRKRKAIKRRQQFRRVPSCTHLSLLPAEAALRPARSWTSDTGRLAEGPANKIQLRSNKDPKAISNTRQKKSDAHLSQYALRAHLQAMEAYSDNFWD